jgi:uncharacterized protein (DUF305 family)
MTEATDAPAPRSRLQLVLLALIGVALLAIGGAGAVALGIGQQKTPAENSVDAGFARDMSHHHLQAVLMANLALERTQDPLIHSLAFDISSTQTNQVGRMQGWLSLWGLSPSSSVEPMSWMDGAAMPSMTMPDGSPMHAMSMGPGGLMPGMASEEELAQLRSLSGPPFDVEFLRLMIRHHEGGVPMATYGMERAQEPAVRQLAKSIVETQQAETQTMLQMLRQRGAEPLPAP